MLNKSQNNIIVKNEYYVKKYIDSFVMVKIALYFVIANDCIKY